MRGSVKRDETTGTWSFVADLPPDPDGRRRQTRRRGFATRKAAQQALTETLGRLQRGEWSSGGRERLGEYLDGWLEGMAVSVGAPTLANYRFFLRSYAVPRIGGLRLGALEPTHLRRLYAELLERGGRGGRPLAPRTVSIVHRVLHKALADAVRDGLLVRNPADVVNRPRAGTKAMRAWSADEARRFLEAVAGDRLEALWCLVLHTGMRRAEVAGLRWRQVDLAAGTLSVQHQRTIASGSRVVEKDPKTAAGRRLVALSPDLVQVLRAWRERQLQERSFLGPAYQETGFTFTREDGQPYHPARFSLLFRRACAVAGVPVIRFHDLRHTSASLALEAGIHPKVVQERLGHASVQITLDTYSHVQPSIQRDASDRLAAYLRGES